MGCLKSLENYQEEGIISEEELTKINEIMDNMTEEEQIELLNAAKLCFRSPLFRLTLFSSLTEEEYDEMLNELTDMLTELEQM